MIIFHPLSSPLFYIFHAFPTDLVFLKWQLSDDTHLVPQSYSGNNRMIPNRRTPATGRIVISNIETDVLAYYNNVRVKEAFQVIIT
jgi:hypothetical protein